MKNRWISILLALVLTVGLTACTTDRGEERSFLLGNRTGAGIGFLVGTGTGIRAGGTGVGIG